MTKDRNGINLTNSEEHKSLIDSMSPFLDNGKPKLGIFWYDVANQSLFGVEKIDAEQATFVNGRAEAQKLVALVSEDLEYFRKHAMAPSHRDKKTPEPDPAARRGAE